MFDYLSIMYNTFGKDLEPYQKYFIEQLEKKNTLSKINKDHFKNEEELFEV